MDLTTIRVRNARDDELDAVADVMVAAYEQYIPRDAPGEVLAYREEVRDVRSRLAHATLIVAEERARLLGAVTYYPDGSREGHGGWPREWAVIRLLAVHPEARGRGIGRLLTEECIARARVGGSTAVGLHTTELMAVARAMYERMGFVRVPEFDFQPIPRLHVMAYRLDLT
ncbi:MAG TPA: GNAT family N-acetyltransferase [Candidatus Methylomirabilis sp.]|nr:GNAT family N-acetyltransferase [Candidatus Methylomirabilis sp.]